MDIEKQKEIDAALFKVYETVCDIVGEHKLEETLTCIVNEVFAVNDIDTNLDGRPGLNQVSCYAVSEIKSIVDGALAKAHMLYRKEE